MSDGGGPDNRRRHGRIRCEPAVCELGEIVNISASGMLVRTRTLLKDDSEVAFWIDGPDGQFTVTARVIRCPKIGWFKHEAALQFLGLSDDARNALVAMARLAATHQEIL